MQPNWYSVNQNVLFPENAHTPPTEGIEIPGSGRGLKGQKR